MRDNLKCKLLGHEFNENDGYYNLYDFFCPRCKKWTTVDEVETLPGKWFAFKNKLKYLIIYNPRLLKIKWKLQNIKNKLQGKPTDDDVPF